MGIILFYYKSTITLCGVFILYSLLQHPNQQLNKKRESGDLKKKEGIHDSMSLHRLSYLEVVRPSYLFGVHHFKEWFISIL